MERERERRRRKRSEKVSLERNDTSLLARLHLHREIVYPMFPPEARWSRVVNNEFLRSWKYTCMCICIERTIFSFYFVVAGKRGREEGMALIKLSSNYKAIFPTELYRGWWNAGR